MFLINNMKIITSVVNTIHIEAQFLSLKKFLNNNFEYIIFNDAKNFNDLTNNNDSNAKNKVREKCKELNIKCIDHNNDYHIMIMAFQAVCLIIKGSDNQAQEVINQINQ